MAKKKYKEADIKKYKEADWLEKVQNS